METGGPNNSTSGFTDTRHLDRNKDSHITGDDIVDCSRSMLKLSSEGNLNKDSHTTGDDIVKRIVEE